MKFNRTLKRANIDTLDYWFNTKHKNIQKQLGRSYYKLLPSLAQELMTYQEYHYKEGRKDENKEIWKKLNKALNQIDKKHKHTKREIAETINILSKLFFPEK